MACMNSVYLLIAGGVLAASAALGVVSTINMNWTVSTSGYNVNIGLWRACTPMLQGNGLVQACYDETAANVEELLILLGDSDPVNHYYALSATRILYAIGVALLGASAIVAVILACFPRNLFRLVATKLVLTGSILAALCCSLTVIIWAIINMVALSKIPNTTTKMGSSYILAIICAALAWAAVPFVRSGYYMLPTITGTVLYVPGSVNVPKAGTGVEMVGTQSRYTRGATMAAHSSESVAPAHV